jgi:hypothetical protein
MPGNDPSPDTIPQAPSPEAVRRACLAAALAAYEEAGVLGLCHEGRWEAAVSAMQSLDLRRLPGSEEPAAPV